MSQVIDPTRGGANDCATAIGLGIGGSIRDLQGAIPHVNSVAADSELQKAVDAALEAILRSGLDEVLSVELKHKHWDHAPGEATVMAIQGDGSVRLGVEDISAAAADLIPITFAVSEETREFTPLCWFRWAPDTLGAGVASKARAFIAALADHEGSRLIFDTLVRHPEVCVGIRIDELFEVGPDQFVLERTFTDRTQTLTVENGSTPATALQTSWIVKREEEGSSTNGGKPWTRACCRSCEWGPFKGHVTYHQRD